MFPTDAQLDIGLDRTRPLHGDADQITHTLLIEGHKRILLEHTLVDIGPQEAARIVAADAKGGLGQIIGPEREEFSAIAGQIPGP